MHRALVPRGGQTRAFYQPNGSVADYEALIDHETFLRDQTD